MLSIIVAKGKNNVIGNKNALIWKIPEDLKRFKKITTGHTIIMGRKTFESLGRVLPNRKHIIFTQNADYKIDNENVHIVHSMLEIKEYIDSNEECFVIGGAMIYSLLLPYVNKMYITEINKEFEGDTFFQKIDEREWEKVESEVGLKNLENNYDYRYDTYKRK